VKIETIKTIILPSVYMKQFFHSTSDTLRDVRLRRYKIVYINRQQEANV